MASPRQLRILHLTASDQGGAGIACVRLHRALRGLQVESRVLVRRRSATDEAVTEAGSPWQAALNLRIDRLPLRLYPRRKVFAWWSVNWFGRGPKVPFGDWEPDVIHAHWIGDGFIPIDWLASTRKPVVWTMHDMWPFTGGCHYAEDCERYEVGCGACPQLGSKRPHDLSFRSAAHKARAWNATRGVLVSPSSWLAESARQSAVLRSARIEVIPNGLDGNLFSPGDRAEARRALRLQEDEHIILAGAVGAGKDARKGFALLASALQHCKSAGETAGWRLLVFGANDGPGEETVGIPVSYCGTIQSEGQLAQIYRAADVFTLPSLQDNLPNTVVEALACGKPTVGFRGSGLAAMVADGRTGVLATPFSPESLGAALRNALAKAVGDLWRYACRSEFERVYAWPGPARTYADLYADVLRQARTWTATS